MITTTGAVAAAAQALHQLPGVKHVLAVSYPFGCVWRDVLVAAGEVGNPA
jgi:hypothetical protein